MAICGLFGCPQQSHPTVPVGEVGVDDPHGLGILRGQIQQHLESGVNPSARCKPFWEQSSHVGLDFLAFETIKCQLISGLPPAPIRSGGIRVLDPHCNESPCFLSQSAEAPPRPLGAALADPCATCRRPPAIWYALFGLLVVHLGIVIWRVSEDEKN